MPVDRDPLDSAPVPLDPALDAASRAWVEDAWGRPVVAAEPLSGGFTSTMLRLTAADGSSAVLRLMTNDPWRRHGEGLLTRESEVQGLLEGTDLPVPASLALDAVGEHAAHPAHLMSLLPGRTELVRHDDALLVALWDVAGRVHAVDPPAGRQPRRYQSWAHEGKRVVPAWSADDALWRAAFDVLAADPPAYEPRFLHRDLHLGNLLWEGGALTGVVDWVETSTGPAELDVAHVATYLALLHGPDVAERFLSLRPGPAPRAETAYWHVMDAVGVLPDPGKLTEPWRARRVVVEPATARRRLERWLRSRLAVLATPGGGAGPAPSRVAR